jgi:hypothetical protein
MRQDLGPPEWALEEGELLPGRYLDGVENSKPSWMAAILRLKVEA